MSSSISRAVFDSLLPPGWAVKPDGDLDKLLDGIALNSEPVREFLFNLAFVRDATLTPFRDDLEKEYGLPRNDRLSEADRIARLIAAKTSRSGFGLTYMQDKINQAGFDVLVHANDPPVNPGIFLFQAFRARCNDQVNAFCGNENAVCGGIGGSLIVNGDHFTETQETAVACGSEFAVSGSNRAICGRIYNVFRELIEYTLPTEPRYWPLIFFIGGAATRDGTGRLVTIEPARIPSERRDEIIELIIKYKPLHSWAGYIGTFV